MSINTFESFNHKIAKDLVFNWLITGKTKIPHNKELIKYAEFGCCEAITFKEDDGDGKVPYHYFGYCNIYCNNEKFNKSFYNSVEKSIQDNNLLISETNTLKSGKFFKESPCKTCPHSCMEYKYIYDIAFGREGMFTLAVEIKHTHPVDDKKIENTPFPIFEVDANWVMRQTEVPEILEGEWLSY